MPRAGPEAGRGTPAEVVVRMRSLKHTRNWSLVILEWKLRTNLLYREFTRVGGGKAPDAKTMETLARALGPEVIDQIHRRGVAIAQQEQVITGRKMRVDTTVVEANIHYPTDSKLLGDGVRGDEEGHGDCGGRIRTGSVNHRTLETGRTSWRQNRNSPEKLKELQEKLLSTTGRVVGQAKRFVSEIAEGVKRSSEVMKQAALEGLKKEIEVMLPRVQQMMRQAQSVGRRYPGGRQAGQSV